MSAPGVPHTEFRPLAPRSRSTFSTIVFLALVTGGLGTATTVAVAASPTCTRLVHTYVERLQRNVVSQATLKRWHLWGIGHPNWHPSLHAHRPRFKKVRTEVVSYEPVDCPAFIPPAPAEIALLTPNLDTFVLPPDAPTFDQPLIIPGNPLAAYAPIRSSYPGIPVAGIFGPNGTTPNAPVTSTTVTPGVPGTPVVTPVNPAPVPEPDNIILVLSAMLGLALFRRGLLARRPALRPIASHGADTRA